MSDQFPNGRPSGWIREQLDLIGKPADTPAPIATPEEVARAVAMRAARVFVRDVPDGWFVYEEVGAGDILLSRHETEFAARAARDLWIATEALSVLKADNERLTEQLGWAYGEVDKLKDALDVLEAKAMKQRNREIGDSDVALIRLVEVALLGPG